jgi:hypothetical protein
MKNDLSTKEEMDMIDSEVTQSIEAMIAEQEAEWRALIREEVEAERLEFLDAIASEYEPSARATSRPKPYTPSEDDDLPF